jgi:hypothetical protein
MIECGVTKNRGFGLRYGIKYMDRESEFDYTANQMNTTDNVNRLQAISPTSMAFTPPELLKIVRVLCNVIRYVSRLTRDTEFVNNMKRMANRTKEKLLESLESNSAWAIVAPGYGPKVSDRLQLCKDLHKVVKALLSGKTIMMWDD